MTEQIVLQGIVQGSYLNPTEGGQYGPRYSLKLLVDSKQAKAVSALGSKTQPKLSDIDGYFTVTVGKKATTSGGQKTNPPLIAVLAYGKAQQLHFTEGYEITKDATVKCACSVVETQYGPTIYLKAVLIEEGSYELWTSQAQPEVILSAFGLEVELAPSLDLEQQNSSKVTGGADKLLAELLEEEEKGDEQDTFF